MSCLCKIACGWRGQKGEECRSEGHNQHDQQASHIWATRAHNIHHMAGSKPIIHQLQNQEGSRCMCGVGRKETKQAGQRGTCQHSQPASHIWATRAHNIHHMAGSKPIIHQLQNQAGSRCMCGVGRKNTMLAGQRGTCQHSQTASHMEYYIAHNIHHMAGQEHTSAHRGHTTSTTWRAASRSLTGCRIRRDPDACVVLGKRKKNRQVRGAHASIAGHQHTWNNTWHITSTTWRAASRSLTGCRNRRDPDACVG